MRYELYLRLPEASATSDNALPEKPGGVLRQHGFSQLTGVLGELNLGQGVLLAEASQGNDWDHPAAARATQNPRTALDCIRFSFPLGLPQSEGERAISCVFDVGADLGGTLFDPQLGALVQRPDHERISRCWRQQYEFQFEVAGASSLGTGCPNPTTVRSRPANRGKILLWLAGTVFLGIVILRSCLNRWMESL